MKKGLIFLIISVLCLSLCIVFIEPKNKFVSEENKINIVATLFPQYDFARQVGGDKVNVSLLLTPGTETHTYEPTPQNIIEINKADMFIYTGKYMEPWSDRITSSIDTDTKVLDVSKNINLQKMEEGHESIHKENMLESDEHEEFLDDDKDGEEHEHHEYDPHIWLNPQNAIIMVKNIATELSSIDSDNSEYYWNNANRLINEIKTLDSDIEETVNSSNSKKIAFGGSFAYSYFIHRYNLEYVSAYESCGEDAEPSVANVKNVIDYMKSNNINVIFYQELSSGKIADSIASETGAEKLVFHTVHNASQEEIGRGETYVTLMRQNLENLKIALQHR